MGRSAIVLAAGQGTRMKSAKHKVLHPVCGKPMILHILDTLGELAIDQIIVVVGQEREAVAATIDGRADIAVQERQLGTGDAVRAALPHLRKDISSVVVLYGDAPLIESATLARMFDAQEKEEAAVVALTATLSDPTGLGRVFIDNQGWITKVVEEKDATEQERKHKVVNTGIYAYDANGLRTSAARLSANNVQHEYYLTDTLAILRADEEKVVPLEIADAEEVASVNDRVQLAEVERICRKRILERWMRAGVTVIDPASTYVDATVELAQDVTLFPGTMLHGATKVASFAEIGPNTRLTDVTVDQSAKIESSVAIGSDIGAYTQVGPFAYLRPGARIGQKVKIGDFVEIKNSVIGDEAKVSHLAYVGDADIGNNVNVGCGVITVNYDGEKKHRTTVGANSFVGSNVNLVAPVIVGEGAFITAGSTVTDDVPDDAFAIARSKQTTKENYVKAWRAKRKGDN